MTTGYVFEAQGAQFTPDGKLPEPIDADTHNAALDAQVTQMMEEGLHVILYLSERMEAGETMPRYTVGTWAGTWQMHRVYGSKSWHSMAGKDGRTDVWFTAFGHNWHGVNIGDNQILRCRTVKGR